MLVRSAPHRYKTYPIPKRKAGEFRIIAQPAREVKALQYWVMHHVLSRFAVHPAATGYREGLNIADNALRHVKSRFLLKLDFKDFFPSIKAHDFRQYIEKRAPELSLMKISKHFREYSFGSRGARMICACQSVHQVRHSYPTSYYESLMIALRSSAQGSTFHIRGMPMTCHSPPT